MKRDKSHSVKLIVDFLRQDILKGRLLFGAFLPPIRTLTDRFNVANQTVSAALDELAAAGMIRRSSRGCQVTYAAGAIRIPPVLVLYQRSYYVHTPQINVLSAITGRLDELQLQYQIIDTRTDSVAAESIPDRNSGVIMSMALMDSGPAFVAKLDELKIPNVIANFESDWTCTCTAVDRAETTARAVRTMIEMGHRDIALLIRDPALYYYRHALEGYRRELDKHGIAFRPELVLISPEFDVFSAFRIVRGQIRAGVKFTGLIAGRDMLAQSAAEACRDCELELGRDISIVGYDDLSWPAEPKMLTTFAEPCRELGRRAADMLYERILTGWRPPEREWLAAEFILRRTLAPAPPR